MNQYIIEVPATKETEALLSYLKSLSYVKVKPVSTKEMAVDKTKALLSSLPSQKHKTSDAVKAVKEIR